MTRVWQVGDDIDTDQLAPGAYMKFGVERIAEHCLEQALPGFAAQVQSGDILVAGRNFGCGSSREQAAAALVQLGVRAVVAQSFAGLFYRNAFNLGLLLIQSAQAQELVGAGRVEIDPLAGRIVADGQTLTCDPVPAFLLDYVGAGGLLPHLKRRLQARTRLDPILLAVLKGRLEQIADEMDATLYRAAFNPIIAEAHDACHGLYDAQTGDTLVQGKSGLPIFVGAMAFAVAYALRTAAARDGMNAGDVWLFNDPYEGGTHANDFKLVRPYFRQGKLFCMLASAGHWHDVGGAVPGNYHPAATECWQEAVQIPPVRIVRDGRLQDDIVAILRANTRLPNSMWGDLNGQLAALELGAQRLDALLDEYGEKPVTQALAELRARAATLLKAQVAALPDGRYSFDDYLDNDGIVDQPIRIALDLDIQGDQLTLDFSRSAAACDGPVNISRATAIAACYVGLKHLFPDVPANAGVLDAVRFVLPDGLVLSAGHPRPVGGYTETILRMIDVIFSAMALADPRRSVAQAYGTINALSIAGTRSDAARHGQRWVMFSFFGGGHGGHAAGDGLSHGNAPISTATIPPLEILEAAYPVRFTQWALRDDSGGRGQFRGGLGAVYEIELLEREAQAFIFGERGRFAPAGIAGGEAAARNQFSYRQDGVWSEPPMVSKMVGIGLRKGDRLRLQTPGGGGYGPPAHRDPARLERDRLLGYASAPASEAAQGLDPS